jgi:hypothetical protein
MPGAFFRKPTKMRYRDSLKSIASTGGSILLAGVIFHVSTLLNTDWSTGYGGMNTLWGLIINLVEIAGILIALTSPITAFVHIAFRSLRRV